MTAEPARILLAEDNPADARLLREALVATGAPFDLVNVASLEAALAEVASAHFDVLLLDLSLPDAHGMETAERARAAAPDLPIVILTGLDDDELARQALRIGIQDYLTKDGLSGPPLLRAVRLAIERKHIEAERQRIERMKDEFVALVSHELRTPLTSIRGALGLLADGAFGIVPERGRRLLAMASRNADRLVRLVNEILDLERLQAGAHPLEIKPVCAADLMVEAIELLRPEAEKSGVGLSYEPLHINILADPDRIIQTFTNLLGNAVKFSRPGSAVWLGGELEGAQARFCVADQGRGIPADKLEAIFERFEQVDASDARDKGGTGLGLPICRAIVEQHGGHIWAESLPDRGSTFYFTVPASPRTDSESHAPADVDGPAKSARRILVVDDNDDVRELARLSLEMTDMCEVLTAGSAVEALELAARERPDAILLDVMMPDIDGPTALRRLRAHPETRNIPVVLMTAKVGPRDRDQYRDLGVAGVLGKPFDPMNLWADVARVLGWDD